MSSSVSVASASSGSSAVSLAQQTLGLADPPLDVPAEAVLLLVGLPQPVQLGRRLAPGLVDLGLALGGRALRRGGGVPLVGAPRGSRRRPRRPSPASAAARAVLGGLQLRAQLVTGSWAASSSRSARARQARVERRPIPAQRLHGDAGLDRRLRASAAARASRPVRRARRRPGARAPRRRVSSQGAQPLRRAAPAPYAGRARSRSRRGSRSAPPVMSASAASICSLQERDLLPRSPPGAAAAA